MSSPTTSLHYAASRLLAYIDEDASLAANGMPPIPPNSLPPILAGRPYLAALVEELRDARDRVEVES